MIGTKILKKYGYNSINEYFNFIYENLVNGNIQQTKDLIKDLSREQKKDFYIYFLNDLSNENIKRGLINFLMEELIK